MLEIGTRIETNESIIDICGDDEFCRDYHSRYTNTFQVFKSYAIGSIIIQETDDNFGNPVQIELSDKSFGGSIKALKNVTGIGKNSKAFSIFDKYGTKTVKTIEDVVGLIGG